MSLCNKVNKDIKNKYTIAEINEFYEKLDGVIIKNFTQSIIKKKLFTESDTISVGINPNPTVIKK